MKNAELVYQDGEAVGIELADETIVLKPGFDFQSFTKVPEKFRRAAFLAPTFIKLEEIREVIYYPKKQYFIDLVKCLVETDKGIMDLFTQAEFKEEDLDVLTSGLYPNRIDNTYYLFPTYIAEKRSRLDDRCNCYFRINGKYQPTETRFLREYNNQATMYATAKMKKNKVIGVLGYVEGRRHRYWKVEPFLMPTNLTIGKMI